MTCDHRAMRCRFVDVGAIEAKAKRRGGRRESARTVRKCMTDSAGGVWWGRRPLLQNYTAPHNHRTTP